MGRVSDRENTICENLYKTYITAINVAVFIFGTRAEGQGGSYINKLIGTIWITRKLSFKLWNKYSAVAANCRILKYNPINF